MISWCFSILIIIAVILNIKKRKESFILYGIGNIYWMMYDWYIGQYSQSILFLSLLILTIWGYIEWKKDQKEGECKCQNSGCSK